MAIGKRLTKAYEGVDREKAYSVTEAVKLVKERAKAKFDETIEISMNLGVDPRHADQMVRGVVTLPNGTGRTLRVGVFARGAKAEEAKAAGADVVGAEDLVEKVQGGAIDFDRCIATPDMMPLVGRLGKVLGPRGMMPNPKIGTVTMDVTSAVKGAKGGSVEFRVEKAGIIQAGIGKASFTEEKLVENLKALADAVIKAKPAGSKGTYVQRVAISSTMGPGVKIDPSTPGELNARYVAKELKGGAAMLRPFSWAQESSRRLGRDLPLPSARRRCSAVSVQHQVRGRARSVRTTPAAASSARHDAAPGRAPRAAAGAPSSMRVEMPPTWRFSVPKRCLPFSLRIQTM